MVFSFLSSSHVGRVRVHAQAVLPSQLNFKTLLDATAFNNIPRALQIHELAIESEGTAPEGMTGLSSAGSLCGEGEGTAGKPV